MDRDDIIRMARAAGGDFSYFAAYHGLKIVEGMKFTNEALERFAAMVAKFEREECANLVQKINLYRGGHGDPAMLTDGQIAAAIRARGNNG